MLHIKSLDQGLEVFKALGSDMRIEIIKLLLSNSEMNMNELASHLNITNGALTGHIKKLEESGIISISAETTGHGNQKRYTVCLDKILIDLNPELTSDNVFETQVKIGHYSNYTVYPTCGLASPTKIIGEVDDPRFFAHADRYDADILWFTKGSIEYIIPHFIPSFHKIDQLSISFEISSEAPGFNEDWPSEIHFYINDLDVGCWVSPGDFGAVRGLFTPDWWPPGWNQYGLLKTLMVNELGTFIDGIKISNITIGDFNLDYKSILKFRLGIPDDAKFVGGLTLFGKNFGNYNQNINIRLHYSPQK